MPKIKLSKLANNRYIALNEAMQEAFKDDTTSIVIKNLLPLNKIFKERGRDRQAAYSDAIEALLATLPDGQDRLARAKYREISLNAKIKAIKYHLRKAETIYKELRKIK